MAGLRNLWHRFWNWLLGRKPPTTDVYPSSSQFVQPPQPSSFNQDTSPTSSTPPTVRPISSPVYEPQFDIASTDEPRYELWPSVLTPREREFFKLLLDVVGDRYQIFVKVRLGDIFKLGNEPQNRKFHSNQIQCKHFDFLLCEKDWFRYQLLRHARLRWHPIAASPRRSV